MTILLEPSGMGSVISDLSRDPAYLGNKQWGAAVDALESLVLAHACAGINVASPLYVDGLRTAIDAIQNHWLND
jgi:hypothetical protein